MNYGFEDKPHAVVRALGLAFALALGVGAAYFAELFATVFADELLTAMPNIRGTGRSALYLALSAIPAVAFLSVIREPRASFAARTLGATALVALVALVAGELTGTFVIVRNHVPFVIVPGFRK